MNNKRLQRNLIHLNSVDSTNNFAANLIKAKKVENGTIILTDCQTEGRGQRGRVWQSDANLNLLCSIVVYPELTADKAFYLSMITALALSEAIDDMVNDENTWIKWPNDVLIGNKKVAGILIENQLQGDKINSSIIGVGVNINQIDFGDELRATSIKKAYNVELDIREFLDYFYDEFETEYRRLMSSDDEYLAQYLVTDYVESLYGRDSVLEFKDSSGSFQGRIQGVDEIGRLRILVGEDIRTYQMGEIQFIY